ncbi:MAG: hypothetical protein ACFCUU_09285 [Cyclobacteriaceae bacterium]
MNNVTQQFPDSTKNSKAQEKARYTKFDESKIIDQFPNQSRAIDKNAIYENFNQEFSNRQISRRQRFKKTIILIVGCLVTIFILVNFYDVIYDLFIVTIPNLFMR